MNVEIQTQPWLLLHAFDDIDDVVDIFYDLYRTAWDKFAPIKTKPVPKQHQQWMTRQIMELMRERDKSYRKFCLNKTDENWIIYKGQWNRCISAIRTAKRSFLMDSARNNTANFWRQVKTSTGLGKQKSFQLPWPCSTQIISKTTANAINQHFVTSVDSLVEGNVASCDNSAQTMNYVEETEFSFCEFNEADVIKATNDVKLASAAGGDGVTARMARFTGRAMASSLTTIFNISLRYATFPTAWKTGLITPMFKKGCKFNMGNYRPISVLPIFSKISERLLSMQLRDYLEGSGILSHQQHGFRHLRSCQTALVLLTNRLFLNRVSKLYSAVASLDYSKAFDCLSHEILLNRLQGIGVSRTSTSWFKSYLTGRQQRVKYNNAISDPLPVKAGVPEGSVFSPPLFIIYINELLCKLPQDGCVAYADDVTLIRKEKTAKDARDSLQNLIDIVSEWSKISSLTLNAAKCSTMFISPKLHSKQQPESIQPIMLNGQALALVERMTVLGVVLTNDLSRCAHASYIQGKLSGRLGALRRLSPSLNFRTRLQLFNAFVKPVFLYCLPVWGNCSVACQHVFDRLLTRCARFVQKDYTTTLSSRTFVDTAICNFSHYVFMNNVFTVFKYLHSPRVDDFTNFVL